MEGEQGLKTGHLFEYQDRTEYLRKYQKNQIREFKLKLNRAADAEMIAYLESRGNINGYLKELIQKDMA